MKKRICNPINISYKYQYLEMKRPVMDGQNIVGTEVSARALFREAADPTVVCFQGKYYLFPSMSKGFWTSDDLTEWQYISMKNILAYDYAPDACVVDGALWLSASKADAPCKFYRSEDPASGKFEEAATAFPFWDPALFCDDDGSRYLYWGCTNSEPLHGARLDPSTMMPAGEVKNLIAGNEKYHGFERVGFDHVLPELGPDASDYEKYMRMFIGTAPYIEGGWMNKFGGKYYLQYAAPGTEYNVYADGVYVSDRPLEGFRYAENNPYSYKPGGFITAAGHGSTFSDKFGNLWHAASMLIGIGHRFERRLGLFPAGVDKDGELFCNQRYGDFPLVIEEKKFDAWKEPEDMLLSYKKQMTASSQEEGHPASRAVNESIRDWWRAKRGDPAPWIMVDLGDICKVSAVQINFADELEGRPIPENTDAVIGTYESRYIEDKQRFTRWILEGSTDGKTFEVLADKRNAQTDLPHDLVLTEGSYRYIRLTVTELPFDQQAAVSGLRVFGRGNGLAPSAAELIRAERTDDLDAEIDWKGNAVGYTVLWGHAPDKLYHSYTVYGAQSLTLRALNKGQRTWIRVDSFNENGISHGEVREID